MQNPLKWLVRAQARHRDARRFDAVRSDPHLARDIGLPDHWVKK
ncbi:hypothetical protein [Pseudaestuariivita atlantica]|nr:hypothetical protein [Pseudaestuariivita atlantica]